MSRNHQHSLDNRGKIPSPQEHRMHGAAPMQRALSVPNGINLTEDEIDQMMENFAKDDDFKEKTWTRRVVENYLSKYRWYFPRRNMRNAPSLSKAYAYYEHVTLPRRFVGDSGGDHVHRRAEPGENEERTELFNPLTTPSSAFIEWGIGVDLYFSTVRSMALILLLGGLINLPNILFYSGSDYNPNGQDGIGIFSLKGTAICTTFDWVVCLDCKESEYDRIEERFRFGRADDNTTLVLRNQCDGGELQQGLINLGTFFILSLLMALFSIYLHAREVRFDEDKLTATDYSVLVRNPPPDAYDPDVWRDFFSQFADKQVTVVTVALNNEQLLNKLIIRRILRHELRLKLPRGTNLDDEDMVRSAVAQYVQERNAERQGIITRLLKCTILPIFNIFNMFLPAEVLVDKVFMFTKQIKELQKKEYQVSSVFVTFETEEGQRAALDALSVGRLDLMSQNGRNLAPSALFYGKVLRVYEPTEPSAVRWRNLSASLKKRIGMRAINLFITLAIVSFAGYLVSRTRSNYGPYFSGPLISIFNSVIPIVVKILMIFEPHTSEGSYQTSLYLKITLFRWINTAILAKLITPFTNTVTQNSQDLIKSIHALLWSELLLSPALRLLDIVGNVKKHIIAPRTRTQDQMNSWFQGTFYNLGERYTDLTKVLFLCFFYSALFPSSFFFGFAILIIQYYTDKYCLMRIWGWSPFIGSELASFSRRYFFSGSCLAFVFVSAYAFAQFPYDNLCDPIDYNGQPMNKTFDSVRLLTNETLRKVTVTQADPVLYCSQSWRNVAGFSFPPTSRIQPAGKRWMSNSQEKLVDAYGFTSLVVLITFVLFYFGSAIKMFIISWFRGVWRPRGQSQKIDFSSNPEIFGYVPQVKLIGRPFPILACNIDEIDQDLIGWNDPAHSYDYHNLIFDVPWPGLHRRKIIEKNTRNTEAIADQEGYKVNSARIEEESSENGESSKKPIFSIIKYYPPAWAK